MRLAFLLFFVSIHAFCQDKSQGLRFIQNKGQWNKETDFFAHVPGGRVGVSPTGFSVLLLDMEELENRHMHGHQAVNEFNGHSSNEGINGHFFRINLVGANAHSKAILPAPLEGHYNYFLGDPSRWVSKALSFSMFPRSCCAPPVVCSRT